MRLLSILFLFLVGACGDSSGPTLTAQNATTERQVRDLLSALTPPPATSNSAVRSDWHNRRRELLDSYNSMGEPLGRAALAEFKRSPEALLDVRRGLLEVAANNLPKLMGPKLAELVTEYGEDLGLRTKACQLLATTSPKLAFELIEPLLLKQRPGKTLPPDEIMVSCLATAARLAKIDPIQTLSTIAADLFSEQTARQVATKELAKYPGPRTRATLRTVLVESTGNGYLRRTAAQALVVNAKIDPETDAQLCEILTGVLNLETDLNFQIFLVNMVEKYCQ